LHELFSVDVGEVDLVSGKELLEEMDDVGDRPPLSDVGSLEREELGRLVQHLALADDELMKREYVHQFVIRTRLLVKL
jgi:hypothetical protein